MCVNVVQHKWLWCGAVPPQAGTAAPNGLWVVLGQEQQQCPGFPLPAVGESPWCNRGAEAGAVQLRAGFLWVLTDLQVQTRLLLLRGI